VARFTLLLLLVGTLMCSAAFASVNGKPAAGTFNGCPAQLQSLGARAQWQPAARHSAMTFLKTTYTRWNKARHWGLRLAGAKEGTPFLVRHWLPSGWIRNECGAMVWHRSVGVTFGLPAMEYANPKGPCGDCASVTLLLGKTRGGWTIWGQH
jgi:hypothetical protein